MLFFVLKSCILLHCELFPCYFEVCPAGWLCLPVLYKDKWIVFDFIAASPTMLWALRCLPAWAPHSAALDPGHSNIGPRVPRNQTVSGQTCRSIRERVPRKWGAYESEHWVFKTQKYARFRRDEAKHNIETRIRWSGWGSTFWGVCSWYVCL